MIQNILFEGADYPYNIYGSVINLGVMFGFIKNVNELVAVSNRIFEMHLYQYYLSEELTRTDILNRQGISKNQLTKKGYLDMDL